MHGQSSNYSLLATDRDNIPFVVPRAISHSIARQDYGARCRKILLLLAVLILHSGMAAQSDPFIAAIERAKLAIVPVACSNSSTEITPQTIKIWGTGFFVNFEGNFVTAAHVIKDHFKWNAKGEPDPNCFPIIYLPDPKWPVAKWFKFERCIIDSIADIAVCRTQGCICCACTWSPQVLPMEQLLPLPDSHWTFLSQ